MVLSCYLNLFFPLFDLSNSISNFSWLETINNPISLMRHAPGPLHRTRTMSVPNEFLWPALLTDLYCSQGQLPGTLLDTEVSEQWRPRQFGEIIWPPFKNQDDPLDIFLQASGKLSQVWAMKRFKNLLQEVDWAQCEEQPDFLCAKSFPKQGAGRIIWDIYQCTCSQSS